MSRVNIQERQPAAYEAMFGLEKYLAGSTVDAGLGQMIRIRASLLNDCQFCIGLHTDEAKKLGVSHEKIASLKEWESSDLFSEQEQAALAMTDAVTHISANRLPDDIYQRASEHFNEDEIAQLIMLMATINAWNRMGIAMNLNYK